MSQFIITTGPVEDFFARGKEIARLADQGAPIPECCIRSFEDPADMMRLLTVARLDLFRVIKEKPGSITEVSERLHRDRSAVKRDADVLAEAGLITIAERAHPGHGRLKELRVVAARVSLHAEV